MGADVSPWEKALENPPIQRNSSIIFSPPKYANSANNNMDMFSAVGSESSGIITSPPRCSASRGQVEESVPAAAANYGMSEIQLQQAEEAEEKRQRERELQLSVQAQRHKDKAANEQMLRDERRKQEQEKAQEQMRERESEREQEREKESARQVVVGGILV